MFRLCLRKLLTIIAFLFALAVIFYIFYPVLGSFGNFFHQSSIRYTITFGIPTLWVLILIFKSRLNSRDFRTDYISFMRSLETTDLKFNIKHELNYFKTFKPLHADVIAFATLLLPFVVAIGVTVENDASTLVNCIAGLIIFSVFLGVWLALDIALWLLVHKRWFKTEIME